MGAYRWPMEPLRIRVRSVEVMPKARVAVARVSATSVRKVNGRPASQIHLRLQLSRRSL